MKNWIKMGLVFSVEENRPLLPNWFASHAQAPNAVDMGEFVRVYFTSRPKMDANNQAISKGLYVDLLPEDQFRVLGVADEPILELGPVGSFDQHGTYPISVIKDENIFYAYYGGWTRNVSTPFDVSIGMATSENGEKFTKYGVGPVLGALKHDPFVVTSPKIRRFNGLWVLTYTCGEKWIYSQGKMEIVYKIKIAFSIDGINWDRLPQPIIKPIIGDDEAQACGDIYYENGLFQMYFCYRAALDFRNNESNSYKIGYATSSDLKNWTRKDDEVFFTSSSDKWDSEMMAYPNIFQRKGETYMLYLGNETGKFGFGAARLING